MSVKIISDSTCDLSEELLKRYNITTVPLTVTLGDKSGYDGVDITPEDIYRYVDESGELPKTSAVSVGEYTKVFKYWRDQGFEIVHFCISSLLSCSFQNACIAAEDVGGVFPVDSLNLSTGQGLSVLHAAELAMTGASAQEIVESCKNVIPRVKASFVTNSIDYLRKGGRCSALAAFGANLFHINPGIEVIDGHMEPGKKYRGNINNIILTYAEDQLKNSDNIDLHRIFVTHTKCNPETIEEVKKLILKYCPDVEEICDTTAGATITTHCGPETLGVLFIRKKI